MYVKDVNIVDKMLSKWSQFSRLDFFNTNKIIFSNTCIIPSFMHYFSSRYNLVNSNHLISCGPIHNPDKMVIIQKEAIVFTNILLESGPLSYEKVSL